MAVRTERRSPPRTARRVPWSTLAVVAAGGVLGALARYGIENAYPSAREGFPWATFGINVAGCLLLGALMVLVTEVYEPHPLVRPFLGTGVLGGFTTFSTYAVEARHLFAVGAGGTASAYLAGTLVAALAAGYAGVVLARLATRPRRRA